MGSVMLEGCGASGSNGEWKTQWCCRMVNGGGHMLCYNSKVMMCAVLQKTVP